MSSIYGPVSSWRLGRSLGLDLLSSEEKICTFDCIYCQINRPSSYTKERKLHLPTEVIIQELSLLKQVEIDYLTFSGRGEPTLAKNLGQAIKAVKALRPEPVAIITNSSLIMREDVRSELSLADLVVAKLDAGCQKSLARINRPMAGIELREIIEGLKEFRRWYQGQFGLQIMFVEQNKDEVSQLVDLVLDIAPQEVQINTPLRPCPVKPLSREEIFGLRELFGPIKTVSVYEAIPKEIKPLSLKETIKRRGCSDY